MLFGDIKVESELHNVIHDVGKLSWKQKYEITVTL